MTSYVYEYAVTYTTNAGQVYNRNISLPRDSYARFISYNPHRAITEPQFMKVVGVIMRGAASTDQEIREAFAILDTDNSGQIDVCELGKVTPAIIPGTTIDTVRSLIRRVDSNFDNRLNLTEFARLIRGGFGRDLVYRDIVLY